MVKNIKVISDLFHVIHEEIVNLISQIVYCEQRIKKLQILSS